MKSKKKVVVYVKEINYGFVELPDKYESQEELRNAAIEEMQNGNTVWNGQEIEVTRLGRQNKKI